MKNLKNKNWVLIILIVLSIPAAWKMLSYGFYEPHDLHHLADIHQMYKAIASGQIPPRWGPDFSFGWGHPLFNYYYVLPFYLGAFWYFISSSLTASYEMVFIFAILFSSIGMFKFLREFLGKFASLLGALVFLYTPYRAVQIYVRGAMGEALALAFLPWVLWSIVKILKNGDKKSVLFGTLIFSLFILSHNYFFAMVIPFLIIFVLFFIRGKSKNNLKKLLFAALASIGITTYWWLPAIIEQKLVASMTPFPLIDHFPFIKQLIVPFWGYGASVWGPGDGMSFQIGLINIAVVIISVPVFIFFRKREHVKKLSKLYYWAIFIFLVSLFFMNIRSLALWQLVPFYNFIQFPWRLLTLTTFSSAVIFAIVLDLLPEKRKYIVGTALVIFVILININYFQPSKIFYKSDEEYLKRFYNNLSYSEDYLLLPTWINSRNTEVIENKITSDSATVGNIVKESDVSYSAEIASKQGSQISFNSYYFPGWTAKIDGVEAPLTIGEKSENVVEIAPGEHFVEFYWRETTLRKFADCVTIFSLIALFGYFLKPDKKFTKRKK